MGMMSRLSVMRTQATGSARAKLDRLVREAGLETRVMRARREASDKNKREAEERLRNAKAQWAKRQEGVSC